MRSRSLVFTLFRYTAVSVLCCSEWLAWPAQNQNDGLSDPQALGGAQCGGSDSYGPVTYDTIIVGAGISGLSAARELRHLGHRVLILERNAEIGGRASVGLIGAGKVPIDYGGAWLHGIPTNPLTSLVDSLGLQRVRTELNAPYYVYRIPAGPPNPEKPDLAKRANPVEQALFDEAVEQYEAAVDLAAKTAEQGHALAQYACSAATKISNGEMTPREFCDELNRAKPHDRDAGALCTMAERQKKHLSPESFCQEANRRFQITSDVAEKYVPQGRFETVRPLVIANAGPLESAAELDQTSAVDGSHFAAGEDDLTDLGMGTFVKKLGEGLPVCTSSPVSEVRYGASEAGVTVVARGREYKGRNVLVTVSTGVLKAGKIRFEPPLPKWKTEAIDDLPMGNLQKIIIPFQSDIFKGERPNSWVLYEGDLDPREQTLVKQLNPPVKNERRITMAFVIKPLGTNLAIGFFGGDWAKALEGQCLGQKHESGPRDRCDNVAIDLTRTALSRIYGELQIKESILESQIHVTRWSLDETSFGAYSVASPGNWDKREILGMPVAPRSESAPRVFFAGEGTARAIYNGSYPGAYESGIKAARNIHAEMLKSRQ